MTSGKSLGKITYAKYGYDDDHRTIGLHLAVETAAGGTALTVNFEKMKSLLIDSKVNTIDQLVKQPIEVEWENNMLKDFRILTEVL